MVCDNMCTFTPQINILPLSIVSAYWVVFQTPTAISLLTLVKHHTANAWCPIPQYLGVRFDYRVSTPNFYNEKQNNTGQKRWAEHCPYNQWGIKTLTKKHFEMTKNVVTVDDSNCLSGSPWQSSVASSHSPVAVHKEMFLLPTLWYPVLHSYMTWEPTVGISFHSVTEWGMVGGAPQRTSTGMEI